MQPVKPVFKYGTMDLLVPVFGRVVNKRKYRNVKSKETEEVYIME
jgi:hypothetical protein